MNVTPANDRASWEAFVTKQAYCSFLQSWTMGEVYQDIGQEPVRLEIRNGSEITGVCQAIVVPARRGKHLMVQYGPLVTKKEDALVFFDALKDVAAEKGCSFVRVSPFWKEHDELTGSFSDANAVSSPMHLLSEYTWYIPLHESDRWAGQTALGSQRNEESILADMRKTTRNLIGRAGREGVTVEASSDPVKDLEIYFSLQEETRKRHHFVPYRDSYIRAQVQRFSQEKQAIVYVARYQNEPVAASVHMSYGGITSYHHGASTQKYSKIPASSLLQWTAISDALKRGDAIYNFWGIAPRRIEADGHEVIMNPNHPFAGVTTFKTGFGGKPLPLVHCHDLPLSKKYYMTRMIETVRKWRRGF